MEKSRSYLKQSPLDVLSNGKFEVQQCQVVDVNAIGIKTWFVEVAG